MTEQVGLMGLPPTVLVRNNVNPEVEKYREVWKRSEYRAVAPGEHWVMQFLKQARPEKDADAIDFGAGTGRGALGLALFGSMRVTMIDFAENCLDDDVAAACVSQPERLKFKVGDLTKPIDVHAAYGYCCDVMEHIPTADVDRVLLNILGSARHCFFAISTVPDRLGALIGETLHLTVQPMQWWLDRLRALGAGILWATERESDCAIYCSAWRNPADIMKGRVNVPIEVVNAQVRRNILDGWEQATPHDRQDRAIVLLAGGPSLHSHIEQIRELRENGCALATVNGAYKWAVDHQLNPSAQIMLDAREFNARFVQTPHPTCRYLMASQCHPSSLAGLPRERTLLWHSGISEENEALVIEKYGAFFPVPGGSTVILRAIPLLRMLGIARFHIFGFDSCVIDGEHHAYAQAENDGEAVVPIVVGGKSFNCAPWHVSQAQEFMDIVAFLKDEVELAVYGDGLIAHIIKTGASLAQQTEGDH